MNRYSIVSHNGYRLTFYAESIRKWQKNLEDEMTPTQYATAIKSLGLSQRGAAKVLGVDERTSRKWIAGDSRIPEPVAKLLRLAIRLKLDPDKLK